MRVGPSTTAALPIPLPGHGLVGICTRGQKRKERQFVPKLTLQSTRSCHCDENLSGVADLFVLRGGEADLAVIRVSRTNRLNMQ